MTANFLFNFIYTM